jgi:hypothetical protein
MAVRVFSDEQLDGTDTISKPVLVSIFAVTIAVCHHTFDAYHVVHHVATAAQCSYKTRKTTSTRLFGIVSVAGKSIVGTLQSLVAPRMHTPMLGCLGLSARGQTC